MAETRTDECRACGQPFQQSRKPGRPRTQCASCRSGREERPASSLPSSGPSFVGSDIKQTRRDEIFRYFLSGHPDPTASLAILTLPGGGTLQEEGSVEHRLADTFPNLHFTFLERYAPEHRKMLRDLKTFSARSRTFLYQIDSFDFFRGLENPASATFSPQQPSAFDLIWLDWMGHFGEKERETLETILQRRMLRDRGLLAFTIHVSGWSKKRNDRNLGLEEEASAMDVSAHLARWTEETARQNGYKPRIFGGPYSCLDNSPRAQTMVSVVLVDRKTTSCSAYPTVGGNQHQRSPQELVQELETAGLPRHVIAEVRAALMPQAVRRGAEQV